MRPHTYPRENVRWRALWLDAAGATHAVEICDVSGTGAFVRVPTGALAPIGCRTRLQFRTPGEIATVDVFGVVRWRGENAAHRCHGVGIEFEGPCAVVEDYVLRESDASYRTGAAVRSRCTSRARRDCAGAPRASRR